MTDCLNKSVNSRPWFRCPDGIVHLLLIIIGFIFRVEHLLENRSFWVDEAGTAVSIAHRSFGEILNNVPLFPAFAKPPLFFVFIEKCMIEWFGNSEMVFRLFPLLCSLGALIAFSILCRRILKPLAGILALAFFVFSDAGIYYAAELKQYSVDVLGVIILFGMFSFENRKWNWRQAIIFGISGALILWFANASVFILAACGCVLGVQMIVQKEWKSFGPVILIGILWILSFLVLYKTSFSHMVDNTELKESWTGAFLTEPLWTRAGVTWLKTVLLDFLRYPVGIHNVFLGCVVSVIGFVSLSKKKSFLGWSMFMALGFTLVAAMLGRYPFRGRVLLFLTPIMFVFLAEGIVAVLSWISIKKLRWSLVFCLAIFFLKSSTVSAFRNLSGSREHEDARGILQFFKEEVQHNDFVFMNTAAQYSFWYYANTLSFTENLTMDIIGRDKDGVQVGHKVGQVYHDIFNHRNRDYTYFKYVFHRYDEDGRFAQYYAVKSFSKETILLENQLYPFPKKRRVWLIFVRLQVPKVEKIVTENFAAQGRLLKKVERAGAVIYLYDLNS